MESLQKLGYEGFCLAGSDSSVLKRATPKANVFLEKVESTFLPDFCSFLGLFFRLLPFFNYVIKMFFKSSCTSYQSKAVVTTDLKTHCKFILAEFESNRYKLVLR